MEEEPGGWAGRLPPEPEAQGAQPPADDAEAPKDGPETSPSATNGDSGNDALRERLAERFDAWLSRVLDQEEAPAGLAAELLRELEESADAHDGPAPDERRDWFSLWSAMTALTQEVKLQGRAFSRLSESVSPFSDMGSLLADSLATHREALDTVRTIVQQALASREERDARTAREAERQAHRSLLDVLLDVRDRLVRGLELARRHANELRRPGRWRSFFRFRARTRKHLHEVTAALERGYVLALARLEEALERMGVREIDCAGRRFDPNIMTAADVEENPELPDGTVLEIYRNGYEWNGETLRPAQVKVARSRNPLAKGPDDEQA